MGFDDNYAEIMHSSNALWRTKDESEFNRKPTKAGNESIY